MGKKTKSAYKEKKKVKFEKLDIETKKRSHQNNRTSLKLSLVKDSISKNEIIKENRTHYIKKKLIESKFPKVSTSKKKIIKNKKILIPLNKLNIKPKKDIDKMSIEELKEFVSEFDLNPKANYLLLKYLKNKSPQEFNKYMPKYKNTLDFQDALKLYCFLKGDIEPILKEFNNKFKNNAINKITDIVSLSKLKLFNFLSYLLELQVSIKMNIQKIKNDISNYTNPETLIFKVPNRFGNMELQYYTYLTYFINYFTSEIKNIQNNNNMIIDNNTNDFTSSSYEQIYFDWNNKIKGYSKNIDLTDFFERKKELEKILQLNKTNIKTNLSNNNSKKQKDDIVITFADKLTRLGLFKERIYEMINESEDDEFILKKIKFIYYAIKFPYNDKINKVDIISLYSNCLKSSHTKEEKAKSKIYLKNLKESKQLNLAYTNINGGYEESLNNPFIYNSCYYSFPELLKKNIIQNNDELYDKFKQYIKYIYSSQIMKDIYYLCDEFDDFVYPLEDEEIVNEIFDYTTFVPFDGLILHGYTQKEIPEIMIAVNLEESKPNYTHISKIICELSQILNTTIHEQMKHYIKSLIFYNSFRFKIKKRINSDLYDHMEENNYIQGILQKVGKKQNYDLGIDGGEKAEIYLYGKILDKINFSQALELFKYNNWKKTIWEHINNFQKLNNNDNRIILFKRKEILNNEELCDFIKTFIIKFIEIANKDKKNINKDLVVFDFSASASKVSTNNDEKESCDIIIFKSNESMDIYRNYIRDASW